MTFGSLFSGVGGLDLGLERAGMRCLWQVEKDEYCQRVLAKHWPSVPRWDDVTTFDPNRYKRPDCIAGGFPCQDLSLAGKRAGIERGERSGLWREFARIVRVVRPKYVIVENVPGILVPGGQEPAAMSRVLGDLATCGYDAEWTSIRTGLHLGHKRMRVFVVAYLNCSGLESPRGRCKAKGKEKGQSIFSASTCLPGPKPAPNFMRNVHGIPGRVDRIRALGNCVIPQVAEYVGRCLLSLHNADV